MNLKMHDVYKMAKKVVSFFFPEVKVRVKEASGLKFEFSLKMRSLCKKNYKNHRQRHV